MTTRGRGLLWGLVLFIYRTLVHYLLFNTHWGYGVPGDEPLVPHRVTWVFITFVGGVYFVVFMLGSLRRALGHASAGIFSTILRGGLFGVLATLATLETFYILTTIVLATESQRAYPNEGNLLGSLILAFVEIHTYGLLTMIMTVPFDFCYGLMAGLFLVGVANTEILRIRSV